MSTIFERNSNQALIERIEKLAKKYNPVHAKNKNFKFNTDITDALKNLGFDNDYNVEIRNLNIDAFINNALTVGMVNPTPPAADPTPPPPPATAADPTPPPAATAAGPDATPAASASASASANKSEFYQELKDILIDSTLEDLKSIRKFQKISGDELKNLENLEKTLDSFKRNNAGNLDSIMIFRNEISEIVGSLKLNITALQNFDKDEVKLANLLGIEFKKTQQKKGGAIGEMEEIKEVYRFSRNELVNNIKFENKRLDVLAGDFKDNEKALKENNADSIKENIQFSKNFSAERIFNHINTRPSNNYNEKILSNAKQFEKAKWNTKGVIGMLVAFLSGLFKPNEKLAGSPEKKGRFESAKENLAIVKNYDKTMNGMKEILKEYAKLSRNFENLEREYANAGVTDKTNDANRRKFNEISNKLKIDFKDFSGIYKAIENQEKDIKNKKEEIKNETDQTQKNTKKDELKKLENTLKDLKNQSFQAASKISSDKNTDKKDEKGNKVQKNGENVQISEFEANLNELKFANKDFEKQNKEFQKSEHRNSGLIQKASDALFGFDDKGKAKEETKKLTTELNLKGSPKIVDGKNADITLK